MEQERILKEEKERLEQQLKEKQVQIWGLIWFNEKYPFRQHKLSN